MCEELACMICGESAAERTLRGGYVATLCITHQNDWNRHNFDYTKAERRSRFDFLQEKANNYDIEESEYLEMTNFYEEFFRIADDWIIEEINKYDLIGHPN